MSRSNSTRGAIRIAAALMPSLLVASFSLVSWSAGAQTAAASAPAAVASGPTVRAEMAKPLQAAQALHGEKKFAEALGQIDLAAAMPNRTPYENYIIERMRASAALGAQDVTLALGAMEAALATGQANRDERLALMAASADSAYGLKDYKRSARWSREYLDLGGTNESLRLVLAQALYLDGAFGESAKTLEDLLSRQRAAKVKPAQKQLRLQASAYDKQGDSAGYDRMLEALIADYPDGAPWAERLLRLSRQPGFDDRLIVDVLRLGVHLNAWTEAGPFAQLAQRALELGFATEARQALDAGAAAGLIGKGADAAAHQALRQRIDRLIAVDAKSPQALDDKSLANKDGRYVFRTGYDAYMGGQRDRGLVLMAQGVQRGVAEYPKDAQLRLAAAYARHGQPEDLSKARQILTTLRDEGSQEGLSDLARLWLLQIGP